VGQDKTLREQQKIPRTRGSGNWKKNRGERGREKKPGPQKNDSSKRKTMKKNENEGITRCCTFFFQGSTNWSKEEGTVAGKTKKRRKSVIKTKVKKKWQGVPLVLGQKNREKRGKKKKNTKKKKTQMPTVKGRFQGLGSNANPKIYGVVESQRQGQGGKGSTEQNRPAS